MSVSPAVRTLLASARERGDIGERDLDRAVAHAYGFLAGVDASATLRIADLGSGGGLPALPLIERFATTCWLLIEARARRATWLRDAVDAMGCGDRVTVESSRAEEVGRDRRWRGWAEVVTSRSFGSPAVTAECASPLLVQGGRLIVSEPPGEQPSRWPRDGLAKVGLVSDESWTGEVGGYRSFVRDGTLQDQLPRRTGVPARSPLF